MTEPSNLLFILGESHSRPLLGAYGHPLIKTPNLDRLAARGAVFRNSYCASPICVPSRAAIATGMYPHESGYWENSIALDGRADTWMRRVRDYGYEVAGIGKFHFRNETDDNGYSEQIIPMHIVDGVGELIGLLRSTNDEPVRGGLWDLYTKRSGVGEETAYQKYDRSVTQHAIDWLGDRARQQNRARFALSVHYVSAHAPYTVPQELFDLYPLEDIEIPAGFDFVHRPEHPVNQHLRKILGQRESLSKDEVRKVIACYFATITHLDREIGKVLGALDDLGLSDSTRIIYTADHGFSAGQHFLFGLFNLYEPSVGVPLIISGPGVPAGREVMQIASHVDLYPTILDSFGIDPGTRAVHLSGRSLFPALNGSEESVLGFAEYHALGTTTGSYILRDGDYKLLYHVSFPSQLFNLQNDPEEIHDLATDPEWTATLHSLEAKLRTIVDPEQADAKAKQDQKARVDQLGGKEKILEMRSGFVYSPPPDHDWRTV
jgi:choline-sulfatase